MKCRICGNLSANVSSIHESLMDVSILYELNDEDVGRTLTIDLYFCLVCRHYQIQETLSDNYYDDYIMTTSFSKSIGELIDYELELIIGFLDSSDREIILDIGCGDGYFLSKAKKYFISQIGFEPSSIFYNLAVKKELQIINDYYVPTKNYNFTKEFSAFVVRQVLEHVNNPLEIMMSVKEILKVGGIGLIEVPNGLKIIERSRYYEIFNDHVNYFTPNSIANLIKLAGYELLSVQTGFKDDYLIAVFRNPSSINIDYFNFEIGDIIEKKISVLRESGKEIALFGMGAKGQQIHNRIRNTLSIKKIFDNDINKIGKCPPFSKTLIEKPSISKLAEVDVILLTAMSYKDEIINQIRNELGFSGEVIVWEEIHK